jgi:serine/threonine protein kinase
MAIKVMKIEDKNLVKRLNQECQLLKSLSHPNIVRYFGFTKNEEKFEASIFMEQMPKSLVTSYTEFGPSGEKVLRRHTK